MMERWTERAVRVAETKSYDVAVIGAGVFGSWTALQLCRAGQRVALLDAYGPGNARASSGGESRLIRMGYGPDELYTRWSARSLALWKELFAQTGGRLFYQTGILWIATEQDAQTRISRDTLARLGVAHESLTRSEMQKRYPQIAFGDATWALYEPESGVLLARRAVAAAAAAAIAAGAEYFYETVEQPSAPSGVAKLKTSLGREIHARDFVFCCGPWLAKVFPELLGGRIFVTKQDVLFFGVPAGDSRFAPPAMPGWLAPSDQMYGMPDLEGRRFKIALDKHGPRFDPDTGMRAPDAAGVAETQKYLATRFPALANAPLLEARVCQYENTSNGDFLVDRHPEHENVWLVGGGSGHGFKHGPAMGEYVAGRILGRVAAEPRFSLETKRTVQHRTVF
jgi:sarcosine oxidase